MSKQAIITKQPQNPIISAGALSYYSNCRGVNYYPIPHSEWEKSGFTPRYSHETAALAGLVGHDGDKVFMGANKTTQWWYYSREDNEHCLNLLRNIGINTIRVFTDMYVWDRDKETHLANVADFMDLCDKVKIRVQLVIWDGIQLGTADETGAPSVYGAAAPQNRLEAASALEHGLTASWHRVPMKFEVSSEAQQLDFYTTCGAPFITDIIETVSAYQSFWSVDLANEFGLEDKVGVPTSALTYSSCLLVSALASSLNIAITVGNGAGYEPYPDQLSNGNGDHPGYPNGFHLLSAVINVASMHPYNNSKFMVSNFVTAAISGAQEIGVPGMYNEATFSNNGAFPFFEVANWHEAGYGGMIFDGMIDYGMSEEPFRDSQGLLFWDGEFRQSRDGEVYAGIALSSGWFPPSQLQSSFVQKGVSVDGGADGGYWSGVPAIQKEYNPITTVSATETQWNHSKAAEIILNALSQQTRSRLYTPTMGSEFSVSKKWSSSVSGLTIENYINNLYSVSSDYPVELAS